MGSQDGVQAKTVAVAKSARSPRTPKARATSLATSKEAGAGGSAPEPLPVDIAWGMIGQGVEALRQHGLLHADAVLYLDGVIEPQDGKTLKQDVECFVAALTKDGILVGPYVPCYSGEQHPASAFELRNGSGWCTACNRQIEPPTVDGVPVTGSPALEGWAE